MARTTTPFVWNNRQVTELGSPAFLLYEDTPKVDVWFKLLIGGLVVLFVVMGIVLLFEGLEDALVMFGMAIFYALLFKLIMPQRFQIYSDRVRIVLGGPFAWNIPLQTIKEACLASGAKAFGYNGVRFATSLRGVVEIRRRKGCNVVISPSNREFFLEQLNKALQNAKG